MPLLKSKLKIMHVHNPSTKTNTKLRISMVTPWDQICGNAEYAKRLVRGLSTFAEVTPHELINISDRYDADGQLRTRRRLNVYFEQLFRRIQKCPADIIHIQHEFGFFGSSFSQADRRFLCLVNNIPRPLVVTLHTLIPTMSRRRHARKLAKLREAVFHSWRTRVVRKALKKSDAIILHSIYTHRQLIRSFPELKKKVHIVPIAIEKFPSGNANRWVKENGDRWIVVPGFVSGYKGHDYALSALKFLPKQYKLVIAGGLHPEDPGSTETWTALLGKADELRIRERVIFTDFISDPCDQAELFGQADAFLLPYHEVGQSGSAALADVMAYGCPVVTSLAKSMFVYRMDRDTVNACVSVDVGKPKSVAACILDSVERDTGLYDKAHITTAIARYNLDNTTGAYKSIYSNLLARN